jgi:hypothetical protein
MAAIQSNEPIGTTARLGVLRLGAGRLGALPRSSQLTSLGNYSWVRSDGAGGAVNDGRPPSASTGGWTTVRS